MSNEPSARLQQANGAYVEAKARFKDVREELAAAIVAERKAGVKIEDITANVAYRQSQVNRILEAAGLTEKRAPRSDA